MKKINIILLLISLVLLFLISGCQKEDTGTITVDGSTTLFGLSQEWAKLYMEKTPDITIEVSNSGTDKGIDAFINGKVDIAETSRKFTAEEILQAKKKGISVQGFLVGFAVYAVSVNPDNPVEQLTEKQVKDIFLGEISNWKEVGGDDKKIDVLYREIGPGEYDYFLEKFVNVSEKIDMTNLPENIKIMATPEDIVNEISGNDAAIGYFLIQYESDKTKSLAIKGNEDYLKPELDEVTVQNYPILRPYYMYLDALSPKPLRKYIDFIYSKEGLKLAEENSFEPVPIKGGEPDRDVLFEFI